MSIQAIDTRSGQIEAMPGQPTVVPVLITGTPPAGGRLEARLGNAVQVPARLEWLALEQPLSHNWIPVGRWSSQPASANLPLDRAGRWILLLDFPVEFPVDLPAEARGSSITIANQRHDIRWLPRPEELIEALHHGPGQAEVWSSPLPPEALASARLRATLERLREDPFEGWRAELALGVLGQAEQSTGSTVDALRNLQRGRWMSALARLWAIDPALAARVRGELTRCVRVAPGWWMPAWQTDLDQLERLADTLLQTPTNPSSVRKAFDDWLAEQPAALAWVIDDTGGAVSEGEIVITGPTVGIANLRAATSLAWVETIDGPVVVEAPGFSVVQVVLPSTIEMDAPLQVHCGQWTGTVELVSDPAVVRPPGLLTSGFAPVLNVRDWLAAGSPSTGRSQAATSTTGFLHKRPGRLPGEGERWTLLFECASDPTRPASADEVRLWVGPMGQSQLAISISPVAGVRTLESTLEVVGTVQRVEGGWRAEIALPHEVIPLHEPLLIGMARMSDGGIVSSWPRAVTPWQSEPGRIAIDLQQWDSVGR